MGQDSEIWSDWQADSWITNRDRFDAMLRPLGLAAVDALGLTGGEAVLDVGCGTGDTTLEIARRVGPAGSVVGVDVSPRMLAEARKRIETSESRNVHLELGDINELPLPGAAFDAVVSRFGLDASPTGTTAFGSIAAMARDNARLAFVSFRQGGVDLWRSLPQQALAVALPDLDRRREADSHTVESPDLICALLDASGFIDATAQAIDRELLVGADLEDALDFFKKDSAPLLAQADPADLSRAVAWLSAALSPYVRPAGVFLPSAVWLVTARRGSGRRQPQPINAIRR